jgi:hypothetical protein
MQPGQPQLTKPTPPEFKPRRQIKIGYRMSVVTGAAGQVLFLGGAFGGGYWYVAATGVAAFAEVVMAASGNASLEHRVHGRAWLLMLALSLTVATYAAANQLLHFWADNRALAITFAGASVIGFFLHLLDGHIRAAAYLRALAKWEAATAKATSPAAPQPKPARQAPTKPAAKPAPKTPESSASTVPNSPAVDAAIPVPDPTPSIQGSGTGPQQDTNVTPISSAKGLSQREQVWQWFVEQVDAANGDVNAVTGPDLVKEFGSEHLKKKISDLRRRYEAERSNAAVNE